MASAGAVKNESREDADLFGRATTLFCDFWAKICPTLLSMKVVVLCSGGMDSVTALHWARWRHDVRAAVSFDYGAKHNHREIPMAAAQAKLAGVPHQVIPLDFIGKLFASDLLKTG